jgi:uncharacterized protein (DUF362 family)
VNFRITGQVRVDGEGVSDLLVMGFDKDILSDDFLGKAITDRDGRFKIEYSESDFSNIFENKPDVYLKIKSSDRSRTIFTTKEFVRFSANKEEHFVIDIPREVWEAPPDNYDISVKKRSAVGVSFNEDMDGFFGTNIKGYKDGEDYGVRHEDTISFSVKIEIDSVEKFIGISNHEANLTGSVTVKSLAGNTKMSIKNGVFNLMNINTRTGHRNMAYRFNFEAPEGQLYYFTGFKDIFHDKGQMDMVDDLTTLFFHIHRGKDSNEELIGSGIMYFRMRDIFSLLGTIKPVNHANMIQGITAVSKFSSFFMGKTIKTYQPGPRFIYNTRYKNFVLSGNVQGSTSEDMKQLFLVSGIFEKDFPWGDGEAMSDVALLISSKDGESLKYGITARSLESLSIDLAANTFAYKGDLFKITDDNTLSFFDIHSSKSKVNLEKVKVEIEIKLETISYNEKVDLAFETIENIERIIPDDIEDSIRKLIPNIGLLGLFISPHKVKIKEGSIKFIDGTDETAFRIIPDKTLGEAEIGELLNLREPTINFNYLCGINTDEEEIYLNVNTGVLRNEREKYGKDITDKTLGKIYESKIRKNVIMRDSIEEYDEEFESFEDELTLINNHFPTATLVRKIVKVKDVDGKSVRALITSVNPINLFPINSTKETSVAVLTYKDTSAYDGSAPSKETVAAIYNSEEKYVLLDEIIEESYFFDVLERKFNESGKSKTDFSIIIKPNFMFMYSIEDRTTFTDPELVEHLVKRLRERGFANIKIGEARSTLSVYYDKRDVKSVALRIGFKECAEYKIIDMSDDLVTEDFEGKLGVHKVNKDWKNADFRISFAKNKTHTYAYYTLSLKNVYGALADEYKFKVFHHEYGDIYKPTIDYLKKLPVHFGFIDAIISADGPFGIFADTYPQLTMTIIGGEDIVAVDWVGSGKMGIDPMLSRYMQEAVKEFGKPRIRIKGDGDLYRFWANIPRIADIAAHTMDKHYLFGYAIYYILSNMDPAFPPKPTEYKLMNLMKKYSGPFSELVYKHPTQPPSFIHEILNKVIFRMWQ